MYRVIYCLLLVQKRWERHQTLWLSEEHEETDDDDDDGDENDTDRATVITFPVSLQQTECPVEREHVAKA